MTHRIALAALSARELALQWQYVGLTPDAPRPTVERIRIVSMDEAEQGHRDGKREPEKIKIRELADLIARMVIDFALDPTLENNFTAQGRLYYAGIRSWQMTLKAYDRTWKQYEKLMILALESSIDCASKAIDKYRKNTLRDAKI